jgi:hypothetical protein
VVSLDEGLIKVLLTKGCYLVGVIWWGYLVGGLFGRGYLVGVIWWGLFGGGYLVGVIWWGLFGGVIIEGTGGLG